MLELPIYALALWLLLSRFGILGAAIAWTGRVALDFVLLVFCANAAVSQLARKSALIIGAVSMGIAVMLGTAGLTSVPIKILFCGAASAISLAYALRTLNRIRRHD
jgi:O-antigen/teichoic acid export membrane protein